LQLLSDVEETGMRDGKALGLAGRVPSRSHTPVMLPGAMSEMGVNLGFKSATCSLRHMTPNALGSRSCFVLPVSSVVSNPSARSGLGLHVRFRCEMVSGAPDGRTETVSIRY
jgi:hypothetical protein